MKSVKSGGQGDSPPSVIVFAPAYPPEYFGPGQQAHTVNRRLVADGWELRVLTGGAQTRCLRLDGVAVAQISDRLFGVFPGRVPGLILQTLRQALFLWRRRHRYDIVHLLDYKFQATGLAVLARVLGKKVLVKRSITGTELRPSPMRPIRKLRNWLRNRCIVGYVAVSETTYREARKELPGGRVAHIPNAVDADLFRPLDVGADKRDLRRKLGLREDGLVAVFVGAVHKRKGVDDLLESWRLVARARGDAVLVLVGPLDKGDPQGQLDEAALGDRVVAVGMRDNVVDYLRAGDVFVFPSRREGLPNALMEAMAVGLPCIAREIPGVTDLLVDGESGIVCPGDGPPFQRCLAEAVLRVADEPAWVRDLGIRARRTVEERFTVEAIAAQYEALYDEIHKLWVLPRLLPFGGKLRGAGRAI